MREELLSFYDYLKNNLIGNLPPGFEWVYIMIILLIFIVVISTFKSIFSWGSRG